MAAPGLFASLLGEVAPGVPNPSQVVAERLLYRSEANAAPGRAPRLGDDAMDVEAGDLRLPIEGPQRPPPRAPREPSQPPRRDAQPRETMSVDSDGPSRRRAGLIGGEDMPMERKE